jgi:hypothetical protein
LDTVGWLVNYLLVDLALLGVAALLTVKVYSWFGVRYRVVKLRLVQGGIVVGLVNWATHMGYLPDLLVPWLGFAVTWVCWYFFFAGKDQVEVVP